MATRTVTLVYRDDKAVTATWTGLLQTGPDDGQAVRTPLCEGLCFQLSGTLGTGGEVTIQGSNDGSNWGATNVVLNAVGEMAELTSRPLFVRPLVTAGDGSTDLEVVMAAQLVI